MKICKALAFCMLLSFAKAHAESWPPHFMLENPSVSSFTEIGEQQESELREFMLSELRPDAKPFTVLISRIPAEGKSDIIDDTGAFFPEIRRLNRSALFAIFADEPDAVAARQRVWHGFSPDEKQKILNYALALPTSAGQRLTMFQFLFSAFTILAPAQNFFTEEEIVEAASYLAKTRSGVVYDGIAGTFKYTDPKLQYSAGVIGVVVATSPEVFQTILSTLPPEVKSRFTVNRQTADQESRTEPFDQVEGMILRQMYAKTFWSIAHSPLTKVIHRALYRSWQLTPADDERGVDIPDIILDQSVNRREKLNVLCAASDLNLPAQYPSQMRIVNVAPLELIDVYQNQGDKPLKLRCAGQDHPLTLQQTSNEHMTLPDAFDIAKIAAKGKVNVLVSYALTRESDQKLLAATIAYMTSRGWIFTGAKAHQDTRAFIEQTLPTTDIYVPAAHSIDVNHLPIGAPKSTVLHFTRLARGPGLKPLPMDLFATFPEKSAAFESKETEIGITDMAEILSARRAVTPSSLFVLTSSCASGGAVITWTNAFRKALEIDMAEGRLTRITDAKDLLHAVAFRGGFPTATPSDLIYDFTPALLTVNQLARGKTPVEVLDLLKKPIKRDAFTKGLRIIEQIFGIKSDSKLMELDPVYNLQIPSLLTGGISVSLGAPVPAAD